MSQPLFSTLKRIERSYHSSVGAHTVAVWSTYSLARFEHNGAVQIHLHRTDYVNGQCQWSGCSYGVTDTQRLLAKFGVVI